MVEGPLFHLSGASAAPSIQAEADALMKQREAEPGTEMPQRCACKPPGRPFLSERSYQ